MVTASKLLACTREWTWLAIIDRPGAGAGGEACNASNPAGGGFDHKRRVIALSGSVGDPDANINSALAQLKRQATKLKRG